MRKTRNMILCYIVTMLLLFFGMNFDEAEELLYTRNFQPECSVSLINTQDVVILEVENPDADAMLTRADSLVKRVKSLVSYGKKDLRSFFVVDTSDSLADDKTASYKVAVLKQSSDTLHRVAVLNYIHDLDGKKRI